MAGHIVIRITERLEGGEPLRTAYAVAEPNQHRAIALFKLRPDHTADEQVEAVAELTQSALDSLGPYDRQASQTPARHEPVGQSAIIHSEFLFLRTRASFEFASGLL
jgi:hypothetical protein